MNQPFFKIRFNDFYRNYYWVIGVIPANWKYLARWPTRRFNLLYYWPAGVLLLIVAYGNSSQALLLLCGFMPH